MRKIRKHSNTFNSITLSIITLRKETKQCPPPILLRETQILKFLGCRGKRKFVLHEREGMLCGEYVSLGEQNVWRLDNFYNLVKGVITLIQRSKVLVSVSMIDCYQRFITLIRAQSRKLGQRPKKGT